jgi:hypothetical protein
MTRLLRSVFIVCCLVGVFTRCESVRPYQRIYLNDQEMKMGLRGAKGFEDNVHAYRETAVGGGSRKTSGGCGCN